MQCLRKAVVYCFYKFTFNQHGYLAEFIIKKITYQLKYHYMFKVIQESFKMNYTADV